MFTNISIYVWKDNPTVLQLDLWDDRVSVLLDENSHQFNQKKAKNKTKEQKRIKKHVDAYRRGDYISQYSSIMFTFVYSTRVCNLLWTTH
jgi:hypothetical protein